MVQSKRTKKQATIDASTGGKARAEALTPQQRRAIAAHAASERWRGHTGSLPKETHQGELPVGPTTLSCSVLSDGVRVFSTSGITTALQSKKKTANVASVEGAPQPPPFLASASIKPFVSNELAARMASPIKYRTKNGSLAYGYEATLLLQICEAILESRSQGKLRTNQQGLAMVAETLMRGFAQVGIIALVDEVTGYQAERARDELTKILQAYIVAELRPYFGKFPPEFFQQIFRIHGWEYKTANTQRPRYTGSFINRVVYDQLPPGVHSKLREINPAINGRRKYKHFQFLTDHTGEPHLDKQIAVVTTLMRISNDKASFWETFRKAFPQAGEQLLLSLEESNDTPGTPPVRPTPS